MSRKIRLKPNDSVTPCPKCANNIEFTVHSKQVMEDGCEVWAVCKCGYDPTAENSRYRLESVMGGCDDGNCLDAVSCWNDALDDLSIQTPKP